METVTVIKHFNIPDHVTSGLVPGSINDISNPFGFKGVKKTLHHDIVPAVALSASFSPIQNLKDLSSSAAL